MNDDDNKKIMVKIRIDYNNVNDNDDGWWWWWWWWWW